MLILYAVSNNFWGKDDAGVDPLLSRMHNAKQTCDELKAFYAARLALEDEYARKLFALSRKPLGSAETGTLRASLDTVRGEVEAMGKSHASIAAQMNTELLEPLTAFAGGMKERRKIVQIGAERLHKTKMGQTAAVNKARDKYEQDCLRIKGYLAQGHMVMGQEERKNKAKLEKTQINMASNSNEYETAVNILEETTGRWNKEWKSACDKFQDLEEERIDFMKSSLWTFANIASTVCVSDDASCEKVRLVLENCEVEKDILHFIKTNGTGQEIPDAPKYINFCRGDINDSASEASVDEDNYSVAQFQRSINPAFRTSSPNPSTYESHHEPQSELTQKFNNGPQPTVEDEEDETPIGTPSKPNPNSGRPAPLNFRQPEPIVPPNYDPNQHGDIAQVPHNQYPTDGMTQFCRNGPPSVNGSALSANTNTRPSSRDDAMSEYSAPSSYTSAEPMSRNQSPTKGPPVNGVVMPGMANDRSVQKKRSTFFSNSPFRRKSKKETENPVSNRNTWNVSAASKSTGHLGSFGTGSASASASPTKTPARRDLFANRGRTPEGEEPADPRAQFQLNVGPNVLDVASPDEPPAQHQGRGGRRGFASKSLVADPNDPLAMALADLNVNSSTMGKQASTRVTADRYAGIKTPGPSSESIPQARPAPLNNASQDRMAAQRGTPPPGYAPPNRQNTAPALGVPAPAFTSKDMRARTDNWGTQSAYGDSNNGRMSQQSQQRPGSRQASGIPRAASPAPLRARSPGPQMMNGQQQMRATSPRPDMRSRSPAPGMQQQQQGQHWAQQQQQQQKAGGGQYRSHSPRPEMQMQLSSSDVQRFDNGSGRGRNNMPLNQGRPNSSFGGSYQDQQHGQGRMDPQLRRERSKSMAAPPPPQKQMLHYGMFAEPFPLAIRPLCRIFADIVLF